MEEHKYINDEEEIELNKKNRKRKKTILIITMCILGAISYVTGYRFAISKGKTPIKYNPYSKENMTPVNPPKNNEEEKKQFSKKILL